MVDVGGWIIVTNCRKYVSTTFGFVVHVLADFHILSMKLQSVAPFLFLFLLKVLHHFETM